MPVGLNGVKIEYQEETDKKINKLTEVRDYLQEQKNKITDEILSGTRSTQMFKDELQEIIDYYYTMIETCQDYRSKFVDTGEV